MITTAHAHKSGVIFHVFPRPFKQKKIKKLRPKMTKIASRRVLPSGQHRQECPEITYMAMGFRPHSFPVGGMYVKGIGRLTNVKKKITRFHFPLLLKRKNYFTNPSCVPHWQRKTSPRSTAQVNRIGLQPFLRTHLYPGLVPCFPTAVEADFTVRPKARQYMRQVLKRTESLIKPKTSPTQALGCAGVAED